MAKIRITDLPKEMKISRAEMKKITGGDYNGLVYLDIWQRNVTAAEVSIDH